MSKTVFHTASLDAHLRDESGITGFADSISFPKNKEQLHAAIVEAFNEKHPVTIQGAKTSVYGGATPMGGSIINLSEMAVFTGFSFDQKSGRGSITLQPGVTLEQLRKVLETKIIDTSSFDNTALSCWEQYKQSETFLFFPPNPTESTATLGGMAATNAFGSHIYSFADMRANILAVEVIFPDGKVVCCDRENENQPFSITGKDGKKITLSGPAASDMRPGYCTDGSLIDFICGSEGTAGTISELKLSLLASPGFTYGLLAFFNSAKQMMDFMRAMESEMKAESSADILSADFFDCSCFDLINSMRDTVPALEPLPEFDTNIDMALWLEISGQGEDVLFSALESALFCLENTGAPTDIAMAATETREYSRLQNMRHGISEAANMICSGKTSFMIDAVVPRQQYVSIISRLSQDMRELEFPHLLMGHAGTEHINLRLMPKNERQIEHAASLYQEWIALMKDCGGVCSCEYGVGRIKKELFQALCPERAFETKWIRGVLDSERLYNFGVLTE